MVQVQKQDKLILAKIFRIDEDGCSIDPSKLLTWSKKGDREFRPNSGAKLREPIEQLSLNECCIALIHGQRINMMLRKNIYQQFVPSVCNVGSKLANGTLCK
ncbi:hypothetical protein MTR_4g057235 [Medicago truncatula]|uniref:Uncharacterized protein n=1 Tax=Medicago truncatula TaxID=3880 RepID=A0A072UJN1_MEDTR|nr:hypothetical protein MTR_4g057235 [Medicago truncatula]